MQGQFDTIVIGSGLGGLECGAMLAREGMGVCVAEQAALPGGCLHRSARAGHASRRRAVTLQSDSYRDGPAAISRPYRLRYEIYVSGYRSRPVLPTFGPSVGPGPYRSGTVRTLRSGNRFGSVPVGTGPPGRARGYRTVTGPYDVPDR